MLLTVLRGVAGLPVGVVPAALRAVQLAFAALADRASDGLAQAAG